MMDSEKRSQWYFPSLSLCVNVHVQNLLIERLGRRLLLMGGFVLMTGWTIMFTVALSYQVCII